MIKIGTIANVVGLKGQVKIFSYAQDPSRFREITGLYIEGEFYPLADVREKGNLVIVALEGIDTREVAERLKGKDVFMAEEELPSLPSGQYYIKDLLGYLVKTTEGAVLGHLEDIRTDTGQNLYCVKTRDRGMIYIPGVPQFIVEKNPEKEEIIVKLPEGLLEL